LPRARLSPSERLLAAAIETIVRVSESFSMILPAKPALLRRFDSNFLR
jgi:hypothetical protein